MSAWPWLLCSKQNHKPRIWQRDTSDGNNQTNDWKTVTDCLKLAERYKLYDVSLGDMSIMVSQQASVAVKSIHCREVSRADADNDDGEWQRWRVDDRSHCVRHVRDGTVRYYQQHKVILQSNAKVLQKLITPVALHIVCSVHVYVLWTLCNLPAMQKTKHKTTNCDFANFYHVWHPHSYTNSYSTNGFHFGIGKML